MLQGIEFGWQVVVTLVGVVLAFSRAQALINFLEKRVDQLEKRMDDYGVKHAALESKLSDELTAIKTMLARIEGKLEAKD